MDPASTRVIHRDLTRTYPLIARGEGVYLWDDRGNRYLDGSGASAAVTAIGHGVPEIVAVIAEQAARLACAPTHAFTTEAIEDCARLIVEEFAPPGFGKVWFVSGGSEATESAVKMALQYHRERGVATKQLVISRWGSYHGSTFGALSWSGNTGRRRTYGAALLPSAHISACHPYRCRASRVCPPCDGACAAALEDEIRYLGPENVAAFLAEPIVGATLGAAPATDGYLAEVRAICDHYDVLFIADEVMGGFGRTGRNFAIDHWGVIPDLIATAKGIAGGYAPLGAVIAKPEFVGEVASRGHSFVVGHTASGNPLSCATGAAVLRYIRDHNLIANAAEVGAYLKQRLTALMERHEIIGDVRGLGLLLGVELVRDRKNKTPFPPALGVAKRVAATTLERGLISYPGSGTADGISGDHLLYAPPLILTIAQADELVTALDESLTVVSQELAAVVT